jgi:hypothetical protein
MTRGRTATLHGRMEVENKKQKEIEDRTQEKLEGNGEERRRFLVIYNISKRNNIKDLCWTAGAHCFEVLYVSASNIEGNFPLYFHLLIMPDLHLQLPISFGLKVTQFRKIAECKQFLVSLGVPLIGIEIIEVYWRLEFSLSYVLFPGSQKRD